jgi:hypothetical protein
MSSADEKTVASTLYHAEAAVPHKLSAAELADAQRAALAEQRLGFRQAFKKYKRAIIWSVIVSMVSHPPSLFLAMIGPSG